MYVDLNVCGPGLLSKFSNVSCRLYQQWAESQQNLSMISCSVVEYLCSVTSISLTLNWRQFHKVTEQTDGFCLPPYTYMPTCVCLQFRQHQHRQVTIFPCTSCCKAFYKQPFQADNSDLEHSIAEQLRPRIRKSYYRSYHPILQRSQGCIQKILVWGRRF